VRCVRNTRLYCEMKCSWYMRCSSCGDLRGVGEVKYPEGNTDRAKLDINNSWRQVKEIGNYWRPAGVPENGKFPDDEKKLSDWHSCMGPNTMDVGPAVLKANLDVKWLEVMQFRTSHEDGFCVWVCVCLARPRRTLVWDLTFCMAVKVYVAVYDNV
jgi:hypothetical protein